MNSFWLDNVMQCTDLRKPLYHLKKQQQCISLGKMLYMYGISVVQKVLHTPQPFYNRVVYNMVLYVTMTLSSGPQMGEELKIIKGAAS